MSNPSKTDRAAYGAELFLVEGESAGLAVERVCDRNFQSVLAMQGKPMNTWKATLAYVRANKWFEQLIETLGTGVSDRFDLQRCRFEKVILLFDPDADGIHGCSLMLWFFYRWMPGLLDSGRLFVAHPPICELHDPSNGSKVFPRHPNERDRILSEWKANCADAVVERIENRPFRGLASLGHELLSTSCIAPKTRLISRLGVRDAQASLNAFGIERNHPNRQASTPEES
jgi:DNA gyrase/topoisomerase IV subunit B